MLYTKTDFVVGHLLHTFRSRLVGEKSWIHQSGAYISGGLAEPILSFLLASGGPIIKVGAQEH